MANLVTEDNILQYRLGDPNNIDHLIQEVNTLAVGMSLLAVWADSCNGIIQGLEFQIACLLSGLHQSNEFHLKSNKNVNKKFKGLAC